MRDNQRLPAVLFTAVSMAALAGLIAWGAFSIDAGSGGPISQGVILHFGFNTVFVLAALVFAALARPYSLHLFHLVALLIFACVAGLYQYLSGGFPLAGPAILFREEIPIACIAVSLWIFAYQVGYTLRTRFHARIQPALPIRSFERPVSVASIHFSLIIGLFALVYLGFLGLFGAFTRAAAEESLTLASTGPLYFLNTLVVRALPLLAVAATLLAIRRGRSLAAVGLLIPMLVFEVIGVAITNSPFAAARNWFVAVAVGFAAPHLLANRKTGIPLLSLAIIGLSVLPSLGAARGAETLTEIFRDYFRLDSPFEYLAMSGDVDAFGMLALSIKWLGIHGPTWGMQILGALLFWVPRALWPSKPIGTGAMVSGDLGFEFTNLSVPIMTEPLVDFGLVGVPIFAFGFGWLLAAIDSSYWNFPDPDSTPVGVRRVDVIYPFWVGMILFMTRGDLLSSFAYTVGMTLAILPFVLVPTRIRTRYVATDRLMDQST